MAAQAQGSEEDALAAREAELTKEVPNLLEAMNRTSEEVNVFERRTSEAQERHRKLLEQWSRLYEDLRSQYGSAIDRVKPYFDASQAFQAASDRVQAVVREFSAAASQHSQAKVELKAIETQLAYGAHKVQLDKDQQDGLSRATVRVLKCRQERDRREEEYAESLREYEEAKEALEGWKISLGESMIKRYQVCFRHLQQHQSTLKAEQQRISTFSERALAAKSVYNNSLAELDRINVAVHNARRFHAEKKASCALPEDVPEAPPEVTGGCESEDQGAAEATTSNAANAVFGYPDGDDMPVAKVPAVLSSVHAQEADDECPFS
eukprot:TRINITY_DN10395_c0_g1_i1.p1 TRINITY_DN10395_c0_g1~~TRINITY_DN10395_c0_g1_i1.p1  ORF type:complete len:322 (-),score=88.15 TRINITY_DN10395_c0_g1_i1:34-999(-)